MVSCKKEKGKGKGKRNKKKQKEKEEREGEIESHRYYHNKHSQGNLHDLFVVKPFLSLLFLLHFFFLSFHSIPFHSISILFSFLYLCLCFFWFEETRGERERRERKGEGRREKRRRTSAAERLVGIDFIELNLVPDILAVEVSNLSCFKGKVRINHSCNVRSGQDCFVTQVVNLNRSSCCNLKKDKQQTAKKNGERD